MDWISAGISVLIAVVILLGLLAGFISGVGSVVRFCREATLKDYAEIWIGLCVAIVTGGLGLWLLAWAIEQIREPTNVLGHVLQWSLVIPFALMLAFMWLMIFWWSACAFVLKPIEWMSRFWRYVAENDPIDGDWRMRFADWLRDWHDRIAERLRWEKMKDPASASKSRRAETNQGEKRG